jgi:DNA-binding HxlR family transcriptional regulator
LTSGLSGVSAAGLKHAASPPRCPVEATLDALGGFKALIVWHLFWGARPFCELMRHTTGITKKALRWELADMERQGLVTKEVRPGGNRKAEYALTPRGESLKPIVAAMYEWGLHHVAAPRRFVPRLAVRAARLAVLSTPTDVQSPESSPALSEEDPR